MMKKRAFVDTSNTPSEHERDQASVKSLAIEGEPVQTPAPLRIREVPLNHTRSSELFVLQRDPQSYISRLSHDLVESYLVDRYLDPCAFSSLKFCLTRTEVKFDSQKVKNLMTRTRADIIPDYIVCVYSTTNKHGEICILFVCYCRGHDSLQIGVINAEFEKVWEKNFPGLESATNVQLLHDPSSGQFNFAVLHREFAGLPKLCDAITLLYHDGTVGPPFYFDCHGRASMPHSCGIISIPYHPKLRLSYISPQLGRLELPARGLRQDISERYYDLSDNSASRSTLPKFAIVGNEMVPAGLIEPSFKGISAQATVIGVSCTGSYAITEHTSGKMQEINIITADGACMTISESKVLGTKVMLATDWGFSYEQRHAPSFAASFYIVKFEKPPCERC